MRVAPPSSGFLPRYRRTHRPSSWGLRSGRCAGQTPNSPPARLPAGGGQGWELVTRVPRLCVEHAASHLRPMFTIILRSRLPETGQRGTPTPAAPGRVSPPSRAAPRHRLLPPRNSCSTAPASGFPGRGASLTEAHVTKDLPPRNSEVTNAPRNPQAAPRDSSALRPECGLFSPDVTEQGVGLKRQPRPCGEPGPSPAHVPRVR